MNKSRLLGAVYACVFIFFANPANAILWDRGGGLIYDDVLNVTWLQDANYADTTGYDDLLYGSNYFGQMTWQDSLSWASSLSYFDPIRNVTWTDWRLPEISPITPPTYDLTWNTDGTTDRGFNIVSPNSELSHLYYVTLGNLGGASIDGIRPQPGWGLQNTGPFQNIVTSYWSGSEFIPNTEIGYFSIFNGEQLTADITQGTVFMNAWAVRDGDVGTVPVPAAAWLFVSGLLGLIGVARKKTAKAVLLTALRGRFCLRMNVVSCGN